MSLVTNTILSLYMLEGDEYEYIKKINSFFVENQAMSNIGFLKPIHDAPREFIGGSKCLEVNLWIGAFNYLILEEFVEHIKNIKWPKDSIVQLIINEQHDEIFRILNIINTNTVRNE